MNKKELKLAGYHSTRNKEELARSSSCACYYCLRVFHPAEIKEWVDIKGTTAVCPYCSIDAVIAKASGLPFDEKSLKEMYNRWFSKETAVQPVYLELRGERERKSFKEMCEKRGLSPKAMLRHMLRVYSVVYHAPEGLWNEFHDKVFPRRSKIRPVDEDDD